MSGMMRGPDGDQRRHEPRRQAGPDSTGTTRKR